MKIKLIIGLTIFFGTHINAFEISKELVAKHKASFCDFLNEIELANSTPTLLLKGIFYLNGYNNIDTDSIGVLSRFYSDKTKKEQALNQLEAHLAKQSAYIKKVLTQFDSQAHSKDDLSGILHTNHVDHIVTTQNKTKLTRKASTTDIRSEVERKTDSNEYAIPDETYYSIMLSNLFVVYLNEKTDLLK